MREALLNYLNGWRSSFLYSVRLADENKRLAFLKGVLMGLILGYVFWLA